MVRARVCGLSEGGTVTRREGQDGSLAGGCVDKGGGELSSLDKTGGKGGGRDGIMWVR